VEALAAAGGGSGKMGSSMSHDRSDGAAALAAAGESAGKMGASMSPPAAAHWEFGD